MSTDFHPAPAPDLELELHRSVKLAHALNHRQRPADERAQGPGVIAPFPTLQGPQDIAALLNRVNNDLAAADEVLRLRLEDEDDAGADQAPELVLAA